MASETWDLVAWLTHAANATRPNAEIALDATRHLLDILTLGLIRAKRGDPLRCEDCGSYQVVHEYRLDEDETPIWDEEFLRLTRSAAANARCLRGRDTRSVRRPQRPQ